MKNRTPGRGAQVIRHLRFAGRLCVLAALLAAAAADHARAHHTRTDTSNNFNTWCDEHYAPVNIRNAPDIYSGGDRQRACRIPNRNRGEEFEHCLRLPLPPDYGTPYLEGTASVLPPAAPTCETVIPDNVRGDELRDGYDAANRAETNRPGGTLQAENIPGGIRVFGWTPPYSGEWPEYQLHRIDDQGVVIAYSHVADASSAGEALDRGETIPLVAGVQYRFKIRPVAPDGITFGDFSLPTSSLLEYAAIPDGNAVSVFHSHSAGGTVAATDSRGMKVLANGGLVLLGSTVTFTATPDADYYLSSWSGIGGASCGSGVEATTATLCAVAADADLNVSVSFVKLPGPALLEEIQKPAGSADTTAALLHLQNGADPNLRGGADNLPAVILAGVNGHAEIVSVLVTFGADADATGANGFNLAFYLAVNGVDNSGASPTIPWAKALEVLEHFGSALSLAAGTGGPAAEFDWTATDTSNGHPALAHLDYRHANWITTPAEKNAAALLGDFLYWRSRAADVASGTAPTDAEIQCGTYANTEERRTSRICRGPATVPNLARNFLAVLVSLETRTTISLRWDAPDYNQWSVSGYTIYRVDASPSSETTDCAGLTYPNFSAGSTFAYGANATMALNDVGSAGYGKCFKYAIAAENVAGSGVTTEGDGVYVQGLPDAPFGLSATTIEVDGNAAVSVSWSTPSTLRGAAIRSYEISRQPERAGASPTVIGPTAQTVFADLAPPVNSEVRYRVRAISSAGVGPFSSPSAIVRLGNRRITITYDQPQNAALSAVAPQDNAPLPSGAATLAFTPIRFIAEPDPDYFISEWRGDNDACATGNVGQPGQAIHCDITPGENLRLTVFAQLSRRVSYSHSAGGTLSAADASSNGNTITIGGRIVDGATMHFTATPDADYYLSSWSGIGGASCGSGPNTTTATLCAVAADADLNVSVSFMKLPGPALLEEIQKSIGSADATVALLHLQNGADPNLRGGADNLPAVILAGVNGHAEIVSVLVTFGADADATGANGFNLAFYLAVNGIDNSGASPTIPWATALEVLEHFGSALSLALGPSAEFDWTAVDASNGHPALAHLDYRHANWITNPAEKNAAALLGDFLYWRSRAADEASGTTPMDAEIQCGTYANTEARRTSRICRGPAMVPNAAQNFAAMLVSLETRTMISLSWDAPDYNQWSVTGYTIYRVDASPPSGTTDCAGLTYPNFSAGSTFAYGADATLALNDVGSAGYGKCFKYEIAAENVAGAGATTESDGVYVQSLPDAPFGVSATTIEIDGSAAVSISWSTPSTLRGAVIRMYEISRRPERPGASAAVIGSTDQTVFADLAPPVNSEVRYRVRAISSAGVGPFSAPSAIVRLGNRRITITYDQPQNAALSAVAPPDNIALPSGAATLAFTPIRFTAEPDSDYFISEWRGDNDACATGDVGQPGQLVHCDITPGENLRLTVFARLSRRVSYSHSVGGTLSAADAPIDGNMITISGRIVDGATVHFTATPDADYYLSSWSGIGGASCGSGVEATTATLCAVTADSDLNVSVSFVKLPGPALLEEIQKSAGTADATVALLHLQNGADPNLRGGADNLPAVILAGVNGHAEIVSVLVTFGADADATGANGFNLAFYLAVNGVDNSGASPTIPWANALEVLEHFGSALSLALGPAAEFDWTATDTSNGHPALAHLDYRHANWITNPAEKNAAATVGDFLYWRSRVADEASGTAPTDAEIQCGTYANTEERRTSRICRGPATVPNGAQNFAAVLISLETRTTISLRWDAPEYNQWSVSGYTIYRVDASPSSGTTDCAGLTYPDISAGSSFAYGANATMALNDVGSAGYGKCFKYEIAAENVAGAGATTESDSVYVQSLPDAPFGVFAAMIEVDGNAAVSISWSTPSTLRGAVIRMYEISRQLESVGAPAVIGFSAGTTYVDSAFARGSTVRYSVRTQSSAGLGPVSDFSSPLETPQASRDAEADAAVAPENRERTLRAAAGYFGFGYAIPVATADGYELESETFAGFDYDRSAEVILIRADNPVLADADLVLAVTALAVCADCNPAELTVTIRFSPVVAPTQASLIAAYDSDFAHAVSLPSGFESGGTLAIVSDASGGFGLNGSGMLVRDSALTLTPGGYEISLAYSHADFLGTLALEVGAEVGPDCSEEMRVASANPLACGECDSDSGYGDLNGHCVPADGNVEDDAEMCGTIFLGDYEAVLDDEGAVIGGVCSGIDINDTFCFLGSADALPCQGLFRHVRDCNLNYNRPALDPWHCGAVCGPGEEAVGDECVSSSP